jgi:two-component system, chemotaxis family, protein-glutamate methylesterase/glutaminase
MSREPTMTQRSEPSAAQAHEQTLARAHEQTLTQAHEQVATHERDIVVIGCSAGGVEALPRILQQLPPSLPAAVFIVQHLAPTGTPYLAGILERSAIIPVAWAEQGAPIKHGRVLIAPPDTHLLLLERHVHLAGGPRENHSRPSIDKLFRSAAATFGSRVIGVLLTGMLGDGVAGLRAIRDAGGAVIVQDPRDAAFPEMPGRALMAVKPDRTLPIDAIGAAIVEMVGQPVGVSIAPREIVLEAEIDREAQVSHDAQAAARKLDLIGPQTTLACPECHGPLWQVGGEESRRYRCYLGHVASASEMLQASAVEVESALWSAVRALHDRATTLETLAQDAKRIGNGQSSETYTKRAQEARQQAELARKFMLDLGHPADLGHTK